ncbi:MAG UNVERIFIED_CONTAM: hypothetical protein LVR18_41115 [Planctomycetaceae bacterium]
MVDAGQLTGSQWWLTIAAALIAAVLTAAAEWVHAGRIRRIQTLVFGPGGRPRTWLAAVPALRCLRRRHLGAGDPAAAATSDSCPRTGTAGAL